MSKGKNSQKAFSISEALDKAWLMARKHIWFFVPMLIITQGISYLFSLFPSPFTGKTTADIAIGILALLTSWIVTTELTFASLVLYLKFVDNKKPKLKELFSYFEARLIWKYFVIRVLYICMCLVGLLLFIVPGIYFGIKYWFVEYIYVDRQTGIIESFQESAKLTKGIKWQLFRLGILQSLIMCAGALALLVGLFIAVPVNYLSDFYVYRKLVAKAKA